MSKRNQEWNKGKLERYIKEGRGKEIGKEYKPWITVQDFPSLGRVSRIKGWKTNRMHELMSDNELRYFYLLEWSDAVVDIREQFPLLDIDKARNIANDLGIIYPVDNKSQAPIVLTTDFFITMNVNGKEIHIARTIKPSEELDKTRVIEKYEVEKRYWNSYNIDWGIVTDKDIPRTWAKNIEWIHTSRNLEGLDNITIEELNYLKAILKERIKASTLPIREITKYMDKEMKLRDGISLYLFKHLLAQKEIHMNLAEEINLNAIATDVIRIVDDRKEVNIV